MKMVYIYLITVFVSYLLSAAAQSQGGYVNESGKRTRNIFVYLLILFYCLLLGCRYLNYLHSDEWIYRHPSVGSTLTMSMIFRPEGLGLILSWLSENVFPALGGAFEYGQFYILSTSIIISVLFVLSMWDYSADFIFSVFLFVTMWYAFTSMNIIRQFMAVAILFYGHRYLVSGRFWKYAVYVLLATGFHASAIIMLGVYFLVQREALSKWTYVLIAAVVLLFGQVEANVGALLGDSRYASYVDMQGVYGVNIYRVLVYMIPALLVLRYRRQILAISCEYMSCVNMMVFVVIIMIISLQNVYYNRIVFYFSTSCLILFPLIPWACGENMGKLLKYAMLVGYFLFGLYQAAISAPYYNILFGNMSGVVTW